AGREASHQRLPAGRARSLHQLVQPVIQFRPGQMLVLKNGYFEEFHPAYVRALHHDSRKRHQKPVIPMHVILRFDVPHDSPEVIRTQVFRKREKAEDDEQQAGRPVYASCCHGTPPVMSFSWYVLSLCSQESRIFRPERSAYPGPPGRQYSPPSAPSVRPPRSRCPQCYCGRLSLRKSRCSHWRACPGFPRFCSSPVRQAACGFPHRAGAKSWKTGTSAVLIRLLEFEVLNVNSLQILDEVF